MTSETRAPSFRGRASASARATRAAAGASRKSGTQPELLLRRLLWQRGLRYRTACAALAGRPDIVFVAARIAVFCDGDFWHGRKLAERIERLRLGHNSDYWIAKLMRNVERDRSVDAQLSAMGWTVLRFWESDIRRDVHSIASIIEAEVRATRCSGRDAHRATARKE